MDSHTLLVTREMPGRVRPLGRQWFVSVLLSCLLVFPRGAYADDAESVQAHLSAALGLYDDLEYEQALEELALARRASTRPEDAARLSLYEGIILADLGKTEASSAAFKAALRLRPDAPLPLTVSPKVSQRYEALRRQMKRELAQRGTPREADGTLPSGTELAPLQQAPPREAPEAPRVAEAQPAVLEPARPQGSPPVAQSQPVTPKPPPTAASEPPAPPARTAVPASLVADVSASQGSRGRAWLPATVGGVLLAGGGVSYLLARREQSRLRGNDASLATLESVDRSVSRGRTYQAVGLGLAGAGVVGLGISAGMYLLGRSPAPEQMGLTLSTDGTSAVVSGRWP